MCDTPSQIRFWLQFLWLLCCCVSKLQEAVKDREAWRVTVHGITKTRTRLSDLNQPNPTAVITSMFDLASESGPPPHPHPGGVGHSPTDRAQILSHKSNNSRTVPGSNPNSSPRMEGKEGPELKRP